MVSTIDKNRIALLARKYHARRVLLFGSNLQDGREAHYIDLAVEGVPPADFFNFYGELIMTLSKPVDLIDLDDRSGFSRMVAKEGVVVYG